MEKKYYPPGQTIYREDATDTCAYLIKRGNVEEFRSFKGHEVRVAVYGPGSIFGERSILAKTKRDCSARALESTEVLMFSAQNLANLFEKSPSIAKVIISSLSKQIKTIGRAIQPTPEFNSFTSVSNMLALLFKVSPGGKIPQKDAMKKIKKILNISIFEIEQIIKKLTALQLLTLISENDKTILCCDSIDRFTGGVVTVLEKFGRSISSSVKPIDESDLVSLRKLLEDYGVDKDFIVGKIRDGSLPQKLLFFKNDDG